MGKLSSRTLSSRMESVTLPVELKSQACGNHFAMLILTKNVTMLLMVGHSKLAKQVN